MRIFYAVPGTAHQTCLPKSKLWHANLYLPLIDLGHEVVVFDFDYSSFNFHLDPLIPNHRDFITKNRPKFTEELLRQVREAHARKPIDLFFSYFYSAYVQPDAIREIGKLGIVTVNWYCNASYQFRLVEEIAPAYHYCLVPEKFRLEDYHRVGANPIYCQEAANPNVYKPYELPIQYDVIFVGQKYGDRPFYIWRLLNAGIDTRVWGPHWKDALSWQSLRHKVRRTVKRVLRGPSATGDDVPARYCGAPLTDEEYVKIYSKSRISLGFSNIAESPTTIRRIKQVRLRDFEAPMSGAFYLVEYFEELAEFFEPDKEIVCFNDGEELVDKARYYLKHDAERNRIRRAGMRRARTEHTWHNRFWSAFREMGLR